MHPRIGRTQKDLTVEDVSSVSAHTKAADDLYASLVNLKGEVHLGNPTYFVSVEEDEFRKAKDATADNLAYLNILKINRSGDRIEVLVETGREADHDALVAREGDRSSLKKKAAVRESWVVFAFPPKGASGLMLSSVRGRTYAGEQLLGWVTRTAQRSNVTVTEEGVKVDDWLNWKIVPCIDGDRLDGILNGSSDHALKLRRKGISAQGKRQTTDLEFVQYGLKRKGTKELLDVLTRIASRRNTGTVSERQGEAAKDVISLMESDISEVDFTDGELSFKENGKTQIVNSESVDQLFVYPVGTRRPDAGELIAFARETVNRIAKASNIECTL
jgi:hypothetical protein